MASSYSYPAALLVFKNLNLRSRSLMLHDPLYPSPPTRAAAASAPMAASILVQELAGQPTSTSNGFDTNVLMILSVLLCALICSIGLNSLIRCAARCSSSGSTPESSNNNDRQQQSVAAGRRVTSTGIKRKALKTLPTVNYSPDLKFPGLNAECAICLSEFRHGGRLKLLPKCNHGFHARCIDRWLSSHSSCPTCRNCLIESCEKIVGCSSSEPVPEGSVVINMPPLEREDFVRNSAGNS